MKKPEIMSPIRNWASLEACKKYADAVYFGVSDLSMRARSGIKLSEMRKFVLKCHKYKIKAYLTINSVVYDSDILKAEKLIKKAKEVGVDAVIVWDPAVIEIARKEKIKFIISTQANVSNWKSAEFYRKLGATRIVLAREMNLKQIKKIKKNVNVEIEVFVHGAMCLSISGRCILSAYLYGKSANCGVCSQPCHEEWTLQNREGKKITNKGKYFLNAKDVCMIEHIPEIVKAGSDSLKIEGRRRDPKYIEIASKCYAQAVNAYCSGTYTKEKAKKWKNELAAVYNRGFSTGFFFGTPGKEGISYDMADNISKTKKVQIGEVVHYYPKIKVALIKLRHKEIKLKDKVIVEGRKTFFEQKIESMQIEGNDISRAKKGEDVAIKIKEKARRKDLVFIIKNN